ncbi:MAG TPA: ADP-forming succinate--CoA ligase subunit beta [Leptospiraceae bacterium]|nr:ADP-forming succinate--CoA ligase subunit beta [Leptospirales bacterium]HMX56861.1 ADP-forming succinate--CoA ligase subunit beta [Leptospiraceae bacterium]HNE23354.1 ADP-forming succinate--CoA ligase subunit beta [Leptospiraceae bacterium]HNL70574.1 ADP-forming succinate--CoA ligase subunit beta [Leptospiraceae bacterium]HNN60746.1 ADP-forming succinate--CoA ligase subunit beta [Leptospiraceae bacterium]
MKIHEYQAKDILRRYGVTVPEGRVTGNPAEIGKLYDELGGGIVAVKSQIHAGGRGKGIVYDKEDPATATKIQDGGVKVAKSREEAEKYGSNIVGNYLVTQQTGGVGKRVLKVYLEKGTEIAREFYLSILVDRAVSKPIVIYSTEGGMDIEEVAAHTPDKIHRLEVEPAIGLQAWQAREILYKLGVPAEAMKQGVDFLLKLWKACDDEDASMLEVNPLVLTKQNTIIALDCKFTYDDNALYRHPEAVHLRDITEEDPLELRASEFNLNYVRLDGNVGCMVNGAGLAMATMDIIKLAGEFPANFLDVGGGANAQTVANGFRIILGDPNVKAIFINVFGGIVQCDRVANGIIQAAKDVNIHVPLIVRLKGTNADIAKDILAKSGLKILVASELKDGADAVATAIRGGK